ncbi:MAG: glycosyltransferase family 4 protein [Kiritimatiellae bacterium]|nr:glycosyltransferase family 4 protein [Kiritimatiellia bacterium]
MSKSLRLAVLSLHRGGMAHYAAGIANAVRRARPDAAVASFGPADSDPDLFDPGVVCFRYEAPQELAWRAAPALARLPWLARRVRRDILAWGPTVLHVNSGHITYPLFVPGLAARVPVIATLHDVYPHLGERRPVEGFKLSALLRHARRFIVNGHALKEQAVRRWGLAPDRVEVLPVIMSSRIGAWAGDAAEQPFDILLFGRIHEYKGVGVMLAAMPEILRRVPRARLVIAGQGSLDRWAGLLAPVRDRVELHNRFIPDRELARFFARCAVVVLPYVEASQSGVEPIAACFARPVVAARVGALAEAVEHGKTGLLVESRDPSRLAGALVSLLENPEERRAMGRRAFERRYGAGVERELGERLCRLYAAAV